MAITFPEGFISEGSFEREAMKLAEKACTTETYHFRFIVDVDNPFDNPTDVAVVTNRLGACMAFEGIKDPTEACATFYNHFAYGVPDKSSPANIFFTCAALDESNGENTDYHRIRWYIEPSLLEKACYKVGDYSFFLVPLEKTDLLRKTDNNFIGIIISLSESSKLADIDAFSEIHNSEKQSIRSFCERIKASGGIDSPSICLIATTKRSEPFPTVSIYAEHVQNLGLFPVLFGLKPDINGIYTCVYGTAKRNANEIDLAERAIRELKIRYMTKDEKSIVDWKEFLVAMKLAKESYEAGRDAAIRSRKADELAGD